MTSKRRRRSTEPVTRSDYLRLLGTDVRAASGLIVKDLVATGAMTLNDAEVVVRIRLEDYLEASETSGLIASAGDAALWVAEAVQEDLIEGRGLRPRLVTWPACPDHPQHPLWLRSPDHRLTHDSRDETDPVWTCITSNRAVAQLGQL